MKGIIDPHSCLRRQDCPAGEACPTNAIFKVGRGDLIVVEVQYCYGCGDSVKECMGKAIRIEMSQELDVWSPMMTGRGQL